MSTEIDLPLVAVVYSIDSSATPIQLVLAADGLCNLAFVLSRPTAVDVLALLSELGEIVADCTVSFDETIGALAAAGVSGVVAFADADLELASRIGAALGLRSHSPSAVRNVLSKTRQRELLSQAGLDLTAWREIGEGSAVDEFSGFPFPAVAKPVRSSGSRHTYRVLGLTDLSEIIQVYENSDVLPAILESELVSDTELVSPGWGDYVSVEGYVVDGRAVSIGVTGKLPLQPPFRECGGVYPGPDLAYGKLATTIAEKSVEALGLSDGLTHVELKLTAGAPSIIEVNARLGGYQEGLLSASTGDSLVRLGLALALGQASTAKWTAKEVAWWTAVLPPAGQIFVETITGGDAIRRIDGVRVVTDGKPGLRDSTAGWGGYLLLAEGSSDSHSAALQTISKIWTTVSYTADNS